MAADLAAALQREGLFVGEAKEPIAARLAAEGLTAPDVELLIRFTRQRSYRDPVRYVQTRLKEARAWQGLLADVVDWAKAERRWRSELQSQRAPGVECGAFHWPSAEYVPTDDELDGAIVHHFREWTRISVESLAHFLECTPDRVRAVLAREGLDEPAVSPEAQKPRRTARSARGRAERRQNSADTRIPAAGAGAHDRPLERTST